MKHPATREYWYRFDLKRTKEYIPSASSWFSFVMSLFLSSFFFSPFWVLALLQELGTQVSSGSIVVSIFSSSLLKEVYFISAMTTRAKNQKYNINYLVHHWVTVLQASSSLNGLFILHIFFAKIIMFAKLWCFDK